MLLCDEPTGSLDLGTGRQVLAVLRGLAREGHHTVLLVTHNSAIAEMADRVVWLHSGTIARQQDTIELLSPTGWRSMRVSGSALSTEYFWPARSQQEILTTPEHFGVVFVTARGPAVCSSRNRLTSCCSTHATARRRRRWSLRPAQLASRLRPGVRIQRRATVVSGSAGRRRCGRHLRQPAAMGVSGGRRARRLRVAVASRRRSTCRDRHPVGQRHGRFNAARPLPDLRDNGRNRRGGIGIGRWLRSGRLVHHAVHAGAGSSLTRHVAAPGQPDHRRRRRRHVRRRSGVGPGAGGCHE